MSAKAFYKRRKAAILAEVGAETRTTRQIADATPWALLSVRQVLVELLASGEVVRESGQRWRRPTEVEVHDRIMSRCTGHCCREFALPYDPVDLRKARRNFEAHARGEDDLPHDGVGLHPDMDVIEPMAEYIKSVGGNHYYACRNLTESGDCAIYETRPGMCRDYPYDGGVCMNTGCTMEPTGDATRWQATTADDFKRMADL